MRLFPRSGAGAITEPFPHRDWRGALDPRRYADLSETVPLDQFGPVLAQDNRVHRLSSHKLLANPATAPCWRRLMSYLTSQAFWDELVEQFGDDLSRRHPGLESRIGKPLREWIATTRGKPGDVVLEALAVINTPVITRASHVRGPHIDQPQKLWTGLLYMRADDDPTEGGELCLHRALGPPRFFKCSIPRSRTTVERSIAYEANRLIAFVNAVDAIHSVSPRPVTPHVRRYLDIVVELPAGKAFDVPQLGLAQRAAHLLRGEFEPRRRAL
jgi:hypothetical protein